MPFSYQTYCYDDSPLVGRCMDVFSPNKPSQNLSFFFVHGGGWRGGSRTAYHGIMYHLTTLGYICASVDYRLDAKNALEQLEDIREGYRLFCDQLEAHNRPTKILVIGSSAGAHLAALLALAKPGACGETLPPGEAAPAPAGLSVHAAPFTFEPWDEIFPPIWNSMQNIAGEPYQQGSKRYKLLSPIEHLCEHSPPVLVMDAANEHMFPVEFSNQFVAKGRSLGVKVKQINYPHAEHGFFYGLWRDVQKKAMADLLAFAREIG